MTSLGAPLARGSRSVVHEWGSSAVAKVPLASTPEGWIRFEAAYAATVSQSGLPVPRVLGIERLHGRDISIFERIDGPTMWDSLLSQPSSAESFGELLAELHHQVFAVAPLISLPAQRTRLVTKLREASRRTHTELLQLIDMVPISSTPAVLCHGDFHPKNVMLTKAGPVIVDWFDACRGSAVGDIARSSLLLEGSQLESGEHLPGGSSSVIATLRAHYLQRICSLQQTTAHEIERWRDVQQGARLSEGVAQHLTAAGQLLNID
jgi:tRNA A-37 threonylcarbamoyl transferase component Bud32